MTAPVFESDVRPLAALLTVLDDSEDIIQDAVRYAVRRTANPTLAAVNFAPRPAVHPFVWSLNPAANERARRWYFAAVKRGEIPTDGTRYVRTGRLNASFDIATEQSDDGFSAVFGTDFDKASYVVGDMTGNLEQVPGHRTTGWWELRPIAEVWVEETDREFRERLAVEVEARL
jgi:hypothetical protein